MDRKPRMTSRSVKDLVRDYGAFAVGVLRFAWELLNNHGLGGRPNG